MAGQTFDLIQAYGDIRSVEEAQMLTIAATRLYSVQKLPPVWAGYCQKPRMDTANIFCRQS